MNSLRSIVKPIRLWACLLVICVILAVPARAATVKILPLGDSITQGYGWPSYRWPLWRDLTLAGFDISMVGPFQYTVGGGLVNGTPYTGMHAGVPGIQSSTVAAQNFYIGFKPDVVLLHIGTNDVGTWTANQTLANINQIIDNLRAENPNVTVLVAQIIDRAGLPSVYQDLNLLIPPFAAQKSTAASKIVVVDQFTDFYLATDTGDGTHPNTIGGEKMSHRWFAALQPFIGAGTGIPIITSPAIVHGRAGLPFSYPVTACNHPNHFTATGLPAGLNIDPDTGIVSGTTAATGQFTVTLDLTNGVGSGQTTISIDMAAPYRGSKWAVPGTIEAENYDIGGQDVSYHDNTPGNAYGYYRNDDVDIFPNSDGSGFSVFGTDRGEWLTYTINVENSGAYDIQVRESNTGTGTLRVECDGLRLTNAVQLTSAINTWSTLTIATGVQLNAGVHTLRIYEEAGGFGLDWIKFTSSGGGGPVITTAASASPNPGTMNQSVAFSVGANDPKGGTLAYSWAFGDGATGSGASVNHTYGAVGQYTAVVTASDSNGSVTSVVAVTINNGSGGGGPSITTQPASQTLTAPQTATFNVVASGTGTLSYQWSKNGTPISGATSSTYTTPATASTDNGALFAVKVTNASGSVTSNNATLTVTTGGGGETPYNTTFTPWAIPGMFYADNFDNGGEGVAYHSVLTVNPFPIYRPQEGVAIYTAGDLAPTNGYGVVYTAAGQWLQYMVYVESAGTYDIQIRESNGGNVSGAIRIAVDGTDVTGAFAMPGTGSYGLYMTITKSGVTLPAGAHTIRITEDSGGYQLNWVNFVANNGGGGSVPVITSPTTASGTVGQAFTYTILASNNPTSYSLTGALPTGLQFEYVHGVISGTPTTAGGPTNVTLKATNATGTSSLVTLAITIANAANHPPSITSAAFATPNPATVGQSLAFTVGASDPDGDALIYSWAFGDGASGSGASLNHAYTATGIYNAVVTVSDGSLSVTSAVSVMITSVIQAPSIVTQPSNVTVTEGQTATFTVVANGTAPLTYQWTRNGAAITGATGASYTTPATITTDNGAVFAVTVTNSAGHATSNNATLTVTSGGGGGEGTFGNIGNPWPVPGLIFCDNYDTGGEGVAYHSLIAASPYGFYYNRTDGVSLYPSSDGSPPSNGFVVINTAAGQWLNYKINVTASGTYNIQVRESAGNGGGSLHIEVDGVNVTGSFYMPNTGNYAIYYTATATGVNLTAGQHVLRIFEESGGYQLNWVNIVAPVAANVVGAAGTASNPLAMTVSKMKGLAKSVGGHDRISVTGVIPNVPKGFDPTKKVLTTNIGGAALSFTLNSTGRGHSTNGSATLKFKPVVRNKATKKNVFQGGNVAFTIRLQNGSWAAGWGLTPDVNGVGSMSIASLVTLDGTVYAAQVQVKYKAKAKVGGTFGK